MNTAPIRRGTNLARVGDFNQTVIIDLIRRAPEGLSRVELAAATGLAAQTVSNITRRLLDLDLVREAGRQNVGPGKPRTILQLNPAGRYAVGVHLDPAVTTVVLIDFVGRVVSRMEVSSAAIASPDPTVRDIAATVTRVVDEARVDGTRLLGVGIATPGPVDLPRGAVVEPPHLPGWADVSLRGSMVRETGLPVVMQKDVIAAAVGESWAGGRQGSGDFAFVYLGTGVGASIVIDGEPLRGLSGNAGEIGHLIVDPDGEECWCGSRGCFGITCMASALVRDGVRSGVIVRQVDLDNAHEVDGAFDDLVTAVMREDAAALVILDATARRLARAATELANIFDLESVSFGGPYWDRLEGPLLPRVQAEVAASKTLRHGHVVEVSAALVGENIAAVGAGCLVLDDIFSPRTAALPFET